MVGSVRTLDSGYEEMLFSKTVEQFLMLLDCNQHARDKRYRLAIIWLRIRSSRDTVRSIVLWHQVVVADENASEH